MYDDRYLNDINYLLNFDILKSYTLNTLLSNVSGEVPNIDTAFLKSDSSTETVMKNHKRSKIKENNSQEDVMYTVEKNIEMLIPYIEEMDSTDFCFFFSPFSILYWENVIREKKIDWWYEVYILVCEKLLDYHNVRIYLWADSEMLQTMSDLDNYIDSAHYDPLVCEELAKRIAEGKGLLNKDNYLEKIEIIFNYVKNYDYNSVWGE